jgi:hypothetical protein
MKTQLTLGLVAVGLLSAANPRGGPASPEAPNGAAFTARLEKNATAIRATPDELKWQRIPWVLDLAEGQRMAREEHRPLLLWATGDDPLERC